MKEIRFIGSLQLIADGAVGLDIEFRRPIPDSQRPHVAQALRVLADQIEECREQEFV